MSKNIISVVFPTRAQQRLDYIRSLSKESIKMLLCYGISNDTDKKRYVCDCGKTDCKPAGKHPISSFFPKGEHSATTDVKFLTDALKKYPNANLAIIVEGFFVIDVDGPKGMAFMKQFRPPPTFRIKTGRGFHYYYRGTLPQNLRDIDQIDIKTKGYVMFDTSRHKSGVYYRRVS